MVAGESWRLLVDILRARYGSVGFVVRVEVSYIDAVATAGKFVVMVRIGWIDDWWYIGFGSTSSWVVCVSIGCDSWRDDVMPS